MLKEKHQTFLSRFALKDVHYDIEHNPAGYLNDPNLTKEHLDKLVNDSDWWIRKEVAKHPNLTKEHLDKLINDDNEDVRFAATTTPNPNRTREHMTTFWKLLPRV